MVQFPFLGVLFLCLWSGEGGKDGIAFVRAMVMSVIIVLGVGISILEGCTWLVIVLVNMMVVVAPSA
jgi:hypothetical protein